MYRYSKVRPLELFEDMAQLPAEQRSFRERKPERTALLDLRVSHRLHHLETLSLQRVQADQETGEQSQSQICCECNAGTGAAGGAGVLNSRVGN